MKKHKEIVCFGCTIRRKPLPGTIIHVVRRDIAETSGWILTHDPLHAPPDVGYAWYCPECATKYGIFRKKIKGENV